MANTNQDLTDAYRLARKHVYQGEEPYAAYVPCFARLLQEYKGELCSEVEKVLHVPDDQLRDALTKELARLRVR